MSVDANTRLQFKARNLGIGIGGLEDRELVRDGLRAAINDFYDQATGIYAGPQYNPLITLTEYILEFAEFPHAVAEIFEEAVENGHQETIQRLLTSSRIQEMMEGTSFEVETSAELPACISVEATHLPVLVDNDSQISSVRRFVNRGLIYYTPAVYFCYKLIAAFGLIEGITYGALALGVGIGIAEASEKAGKFLAKSRLGRHLALESSVPVAQIRYFPQGVLPEQTENPNQREE